MANFIKYFIITIFVLVSLFILRNFINFIQNTNAEYKRYLEEAKCDLKCYGGSYHIINSNLSNVLSTCNHITDRNYAHPSCHINDPPEITVVSLSETSLIE